MENVPDTAILSRRFGVTQTTMSEGGVPTTKDRPIDDLTESLVNLTNSSSHTISPMGVDLIAAGIVHRLVAAPSKPLVAKTVDLRKN